MLGITQDEVRRHPRWREELRTPLNAPNVHRAPGSRWLAVVGFLIVIAAITVVVLN
ncbi:MAG TPA: hypothetical protein VFD64_15495 [Gemmatimonadaceae bacterium]|nr:hypothetical protein [Gemmatimonadaceae bacterium]